MLVVLLTEKMSWASIVSRRVLLRAEVSHLGLPAAPRWGRREIWGLKRKKKRMTFR